LRLPRDCGNRYYDIFDCTTRLQATDCGESISPSTAKRAIWHRLSGKTPLQPIVIKAFDKKLLRGAYAAIAGPATWPPGGPA